MNITGETSIEEIVDRIPGAVSYLAEKGIRCIICGETIWGSLGEAASEKGYGEKEISAFINDLSKMMEPGNA